MEKRNTFLEGSVPALPPRKLWAHRKGHSTVLLLSAIAAILWFQRWSLSLPTKDDVIQEHKSPYGNFPHKDDAFQFIPCTQDSHLPALSDAKHRETWAKLFDPNPDHWSWGSASSDQALLGHSSDPYRGRGIYLCGYLDVPLDYTNSSDARIARLAITKYQVSGLALQDGKCHADDHAGHKSERTVIVEPGGPGGSGGSYVWRAAEQVSQRLSLGRYDVLGWDPRGVNESLPGASCFPYDADRDRWNLLTQQYRAALNVEPQAQLELADTMNEAIFASCKETLGDLGRFVSTAFVARDLDQILTVLDEPELTGYFVSYGTGIGQTYANMFPNRVGRLIMDGTEYVRDHRLVGGFGWTALDNGTDAWNDGFLGECVQAGPKNCALAQPLAEDGKDVSLADLQSRMSKLLSRFAAQPMPAYLPSSGPSLVTYSQLVAGIYQTMYNAFAWPALARALYDLEKGNATLAAKMMDEAGWEFHPPATCPTPSRNTPSTDELGMLVICADSYDSELPWVSHDGKDGDVNDLSWWGDLWQNMTTRSWIAGNSRFFDVLPCRHYTRYFGSSAEVYRGDLNHTLSNPVLLIAEIYDPATPLRNGRRLLAEMGDNARLIVHHGYGHSSRDTSKCTDELARAYILNGALPEHSETDCFADEKPYRYAKPAMNIASHEGGSEDWELEIWREHMREMKAYHPNSFRGRR